MNQDPRNSTLQQTRTFTNQHVLNEVRRDPVEEQLALRYLDKWAPDLVGVIMGHLL
jgi:hypothetical protein